MVTTLPLDTKKQIIRLYGDIMKIFLENHSEEYAVREMVSAYFPKQKYEIVYDAPSHDEDSDYVYSSYCKEKNSHNFFCRVHIDKTNLENKVVGLEFDKNQIKKSISLCLEKLTGIHLPWGLMTGIRPSKNVREFLNDGGKNPEDYLLDRFGCDLSKAKLATLVEKTESEYIRSKYDDGISIYIGIPFCPTRCLYCSFTSQSIAFSNKLVSPYMDSLIYEIEEVSKLDYVKRRRIETVYFGGGTPSALSHLDIERLFVSLEENFDLSFVKEITFEAGRPDTVTKEKLEVLKKHNVTRISINPQTMNDETLKIIGRNHTSKDFLESFHLAREMGFSHINCDIIAGLPGERESDFENTLSELERLQPESITVHTMSIKHGSFLDMNYDMYSMTASNTVNAMLNMAHYVMTKNGMHPYYMYRQKNMLGNLENVGYCKNGCECIYNIYIMEEVQSIIALGSGGSTKLVDNDRIERAFNVKEVSEYIKRTDEMIQRKIDLAKMF